MRTEELIAVLAADTTPVTRFQPQKRLAAVAAAGAAIALVLVLTWLKLRPDLAAALGGGFFWVKAAYTGALAAAFYWASERLGRPGATARPALFAAAVAAALIIIPAVVQFAGLGPEARLASLQGGSWTVCTRNIFVLGAPATVLGLLVIRALAPTRPALAGSCVGMFAGGVAATVYGLHCPESTLVFVALWYTLGLLSCGALGALLGRFMLRW